MGYSIKLSETVSYDLVFRNAGIFNAAGMAAARKEI